MHLQSNMRARLLSDLQAYDVASLLELLRSEAPLLFLSVFHSYVVLGVETFGLGLRERSGRDKEENGGNRADFFHTHIVFIMLLPLP